MKHLVLIIILAATLAGCGSRQPSIVSTRPNAGDSGVPVSPPVVQITFNQSMDIATVEPSIRITPGVGTGTPDYSWSNNNSVVSVTYGQVFEPGTTYTVEVGKDAASADGVKLPDVYRFTFSTVQPAPATTAPRATPSQTPGSAQRTGEEERAAGQARPNVQGGSTNVPSSPKQAQQTLSFAADIKPLADQRCKGCHKADMSNYNTITTKKWVIAEDSGHSPYLIKGSGKQGHPGGNVWKDKADVVKHWIDSGAAK